MNNGQKIKEVEDYFNELEKTGYSFQQTGRHYVKIAKEGKQVVRKLIYLFQSAQATESYQWLLDNLYSQAHSAEITSALKTLSPSLVSSASTVSAQAYLISSLDDLPSTEDHDSLMCELDEYLIQCRKEFEIKTDFVQQRRGAWSVFYSDSQDRLTQAAHSMRLIMTVLISTIATNEKIEGAGIQLSSDDKDGENLRKRIIFLLFGSESTASEKAVDLVTETIKKCDKDYSRLKSIAHGSRAEEEEVRSLLIKIELTLLGILRPRYERNKN